MVSIILLTHGPLAEAFVASAKLILGDFDGVSTFSLNLGDDIAALHEQVKQGILQKCETSDVLVLTDIPGGSPTNISAACLQDAHFECLTGVNLAMVLEAILTREGIVDFGAYVEQVVFAGRSGIINVREMIEPMK